MTDTTHLSFNHILDKLNGPQHDAVTHEKGPLLIFAGAGSGKTRVLTHRIAYLIKKQLATPSQIMAVTFTNKAANEMRLRIGRLLAGNVRDMRVGTFHALCARFLREHGTSIGVPDNFVIFDSDDQTTLVKQCLASLEIDPKQLKPSTVLHYISSAKNELITPENYKPGTRNPAEQRIGRLYTLYQQKLEENHGVDFDDLIMKTVELFRKDKELLAELQEQFRFVFVDEYQDINKAQYELINLVAKKYKNICVVGDDDQSIYSWRGADSGLLLRFEKDYPDARVVKLEQNYRSPQTILDAAYHVIKKNEDRKEKRLWTEREGGSRIKCFQAQDEHDEAAFIARTIP